MQLRACARINDGVEYGLHRRTNELRAAKLSCQQLVLPVRVHEIFV